MQEFLLVAQKITLKKQHWSKLTTDSSFMLER